MKKLLLVSALLSIGPQAFAAVCQANLQAGSGKVVQTFTETAANQTMACTQALRSCNYDLKQRQLDGKMPNGNCRLSSDVTSSQPIPPHQPGNGRRVPSFQYELDQLQNAYNSSSLQTRRYAVEQLVNYPSVRALKMSIHALNDNVYEVKSAANASFNQLLSVIDVYYNEQIIIEEMSFMLKDYSSRKRKAAATVLGKVTTAMAAIPLIEATADNVWEVYTEAQISLNQVMQSMDIKRVVKTNLDIFATLMRSNHYKKRVNTIKVVSMANAPITVVMLVQAVGDNVFEINSEAKRAVHQLINSPNYTNIGIDTVMSLSTHLKNSNSQVRKYAAQALGASHHYAAREPLQEALNDSNWEVRQAIIEALRIL